MIENHDLGLLSQYELFIRSEHDSPYEMGADPRRNPVTRLLSAANLANRCNLAEIPQLLELLRDQDSALRRWGAIGLLSLRAKGASTANALLPASKDQAPDVRITAAEALCGLGRAEAATPVLIDLLSHESRIVRNETLMALYRVGPPARAALPHLERALAPSKHSGLWSYDNILAAISLARSCLSDQLVQDGVELPPSRSHPVAASARLKLTRQKCLP
jgi:HEAT repeat protein